jgi:hypothetical protein
MGALAVLLAALPAALPDASARLYRVEIGGLAVGTAELRVRCERARCTATFETAFRLPEAGGGGVARRSTAVVTDRAGTLLEVESAGRRRKAAGEAVASILAETLLSAAPEGARRCLAVEDADTGRKGEACATRRGEWLSGEVLGDAVRFRAAPRALPDEVLLPEQGTRFVADARAAVPSRAPAGFGNAVPAPPGAELERDSRFCGLAPEPEDPSPPPRGLPRDFPERGGCQERSADYLRAAREDGIEGRLVVGVAWDGARFVWHEWVELAAGGRWTAVDPSFRQLPAQAPRFAVARFAPGDEAGRAEAGRKVLACWGRGVTLAAPR